MLGLVLLSIPLGFMIALPLTAMLVKVGRRMGTTDSLGSVGHEKVLRDVPNIGGIAIAAGVLVPLAGCLLILALIGPIQLAEYVPSVSDFLDRLQSQQGPWWSIVIGALILHLMGLRDDRVPLSPWPKLCIQVAVASAVVFFGGLRLLTALDQFGQAGIAFSAVLTVIWIVVLTNAINFLDNMDGLAAGVAGIAATVFMAATIINGQYFTAITFGLLAGSLLGFLVYNVAPARIFMGDAGSLVVGFLLATLTVRTTFVDPANTSFALGSAWYGVLMPVVVLAIPLYDFVAVTTIRIRQGRSPFRGDQQHLSHRLLDLGLSKVTAVIVIWALSMATGVGGIVLGSLNLWQAIMVVGQTLAILLVLAILELGGHASRSKDSNT